MSIHRKKHTRCFRSYTDINNYNNFLLELDKKQSIEYCINTEESTPNNSITGKKDMQQFLNSITEQYAQIQYPIFNVNCEQPLFPDEYLKPYTSPKIRVNISTELNNINDILLLIESYPLDKNIEYNINMEALHKIKQPLTDLNNMIGMTQLKENILDQLIFYIQNLHTLNKSVKGNDFMHTVIYGPPGTGKTDVAKIIGSIFSKIGILSKGTFKKVTRTDLIAGFLGQTAIKTKDVINESLGGVLFIDEVYALGNEEKRDSFSKECIDTLCESLSDHKDNLMVIIAGYEKELNSCFFNYNQGLQSRFTWRFKTDEYTAQDLYNIFLKKVNDFGWFISDNSGIDVKWFHKNKKHFKYFGRDIETLFTKTKIAHSRRVFCLDSSVKKYITIHDLDKGLQLYLKNEDSNEKNNDKIRNLISSMYI
jgi:SpoVK/Ycf46/Vps4 family AAA+-type ATPase